jgi:O-antigen/teichoic acid export membrane protein
VHLSFSVSKLFANNENSADLGRQVFRGGFITTTAKVIQSVLQIASTVILARLLAPEDFGLMAIIFALTSFAPMLIDCGLGDVTVQRKTISHAQVSSLFWINLGIGCAVAALLAMGSGAIARIYDQPRLQSMTAAFGLTFIFSALAMQHMALLRRSMRFTDLAVIETTAFTLAAVVAITMAALGAGYWSLVVRPILASFLTAMGAWVLSRWRPGFPSATPELKGNLSFGFSVSVGAVAHIIANSLDRTCLGYFFIPRVVGYYQYGFLLYENAFSAIVSPLNSVGMAALSKLQGDHELLKQKYLAACSFISFYAMPAFTILAVSGRDLTPFLLGEKWAPAGLILSIFALRGLVHFFETSQVWLHLALGKPQRFARWAFLTVVIQIVALTLGLPFGIEGVALSIVVTRGLAAIPSILYAGSPMGLRFTHLVKAVGKPFLGALIAGVLGFAILSLLPAELPRFWKILFPSLATIAVYTSVVIGIFRWHEPLRRPFQAVRRFTPKRLHPWIPFATAEAGLVGKSV